MPHASRTGQSAPLGATVYPDGTNFSIFSKYASAVELLLFKADDHSKPLQVFRLNPETNKTFYYWHIFLEDVQEGQLYGWKIYGPYAPEIGYYFDGNKLLTDPYAKAVVMDTYDREAAKRPGDNTAAAIKSVVVGGSTYDWEGDRPLNHPYSHSIIYELHVGGFTKHPNSGVPDDLRGTYRGLIEKIPYLKELGINSVELMPVQQFDPADVPDPSRTNYWGYAPIALFAPHTGFASTQDPIGAVHEFRDMVKALHRAGIEVILDVVFNHTGEGGADGPILSFKSIENRAYYMLDEQYQYRNYSGTGNTLNTNHSVVRRLIRDCLRYWVDEMHVDGFRFDLASILSRDENGRPVQNPPILWEIESDPVLAPTKIIAEAWDVQQYQLGNFVGDKWAEWNGAYRDDMRRFLKSDQGMVPIAANRVNASPDLFRKLLRDPNRSINFITCHDGFTLNDLVSYDQKHNWANGEGNRDGHNDNHSWNCGAEGPTQDPEVLQLRQRQVKNHLTLLLLSQGTPMLLMGDEVRRSQQGNNNAYCQDNELSWFDWDAVAQQQDLLRFVKALIQLNLNTPYFQEHFYWNSPKALGGSRCRMGGVRNNQPDWGHDSHTLSYTLKNNNYQYRMHVMVNTFWEHLNFQIPKPKGGKLWRRIINTAAESPQDIHTFEEAPVIRGGSVYVNARSVVVLVDGQ
ncbi:MAG: glycogen debranching protein GlgX [Phaeodactylibacter sp.]|uniref:glycogen debranching protein GlgX n=1 Tax=Phaeodactylibacter sp. TaxID=1940289 RepID=UPI0032EB2D68